MQVHHFEYSPPPIKFSATIQREISDRHPHPKSLLSIMNHLWSPWRMSYILENKNEEGCVFCKVLESADDCQNLIVYRGKSSYVILNRYPYTSGHLMVVPMKHCATMQALSSATRGEMMELISRCVQVLTDGYQAQGFGAACREGMGQDCP